MKNGRNPSIELLRLCFVFGIVLLHVMTQGGYFTRAGINLLSTCVDGFVFISGYFGIRLKPKKLLGLIGLAAFYRILLGDGISNGYQDFIKDWFLWGYVVLSLVAPMVEAAFSGWEKKKVLAIGLPIVLGVYVWSYLCVIPWTKSFVPAPYGFAPLSYTTLIGIYMAARMFRILEVERYLSHPWINVICFICASSLVWVGFYHHNSPMSFIVVAYAYVFFKRLRLPNWVSLLVTGLAPSAFAVYVLHSSHIGHCFFSKGLQYCIDGHGVNRFAAYVAVAMLLCVGCMMVDGIRRCLVTVVSVLCRRMGLPKMSNVMLFFALSVVVAEVRADVDWRDQLVSISGDSYSDWKSYSRKTVTRESQMWWAQVIAELGGTKSLNTARAGCAYSYTYGVCPVIWYLNQDHALGWNPDVILSMGGLNDFWALEQTPGYGCTDAQFRLGLNKLFNLYDSDYAGAEVYQIIPKAHCTNDYLWGLSPRYRRAIRELARARGYHVIDLDGYFGTEVGDTDTPTYPHPTLQGMNKIAARVINEIRNGCGGYATAYDYLETDGVGYVLTDVETNAATRVEFKIRSNADKFESLRVSGGESLRVSGGESLRVSGFEGLRDVVESRSVDGFCEQLVIGCASPSNDNSPLQLYSLKIYEGSALKHSYIPVKDKYGNATLYDECEDRCLVVRGGTWKVLNYEGAFVNYEKCMAYGSLAEAYADAAEGETVTVRELPAEPEEVIGRIGVKIDTRGFAGVTMVSRHTFYDAVLKDGIWQLVPVDIQPKFLCERVEDLWTPGADGQVRIRLGNVRSNLYYSVYTATNCLGPWKCVGLGFEQSEFSYPAPELGESFFVKAMVEE